MAYHPEYYRGGGRANGQTYVNTIVAKHAGRDRYLAYEMRRAITEAAALHKTPEIIQAERFNKMRTDGMNMRDIRITLGLNEV